MKKLTIVIHLIMLSPSTLLGREVEVYTLDQLDEPRGYCLDIKGYKLKAQPKRGLQVHTCYSYQGEIAADQGFDSLSFTKNQFFLPAFDVCMEVPSASSSSHLVLRECRDITLQEFTWGIKDRIHPISDINLCLTVDRGAPSKGGGGSPVHLKRNLTLDNCNETLSIYQGWGVRKID